MTTPWVDALTLPASDEALRKKVCVSPVERPDLDKLPLGDAIESLGFALDAFYSASQQDLDLIREIVGCGAARARVTHSSHEQFVASAHGRRSAVDYPTIRLVTGHAGVGKSHLLKAIERGLRTGREVRASNNLPAFQLIPAIYCEVGTLSSKIAVLQHLLDCLERQENPDKGVTPPGGKLHALAKRLSVSLYQRGTVLGLADELQFNSRSSEATALIAQIISQVGSLGPALFFACNYSLVHKLKKRPPEDRNRFLAKPRVMLPLLPDDPAFSQYFINAGVVLCGAIVALSQEDLGELHSMTFGLRRMMASLVVAAYAIARQERGKTRSGLAITMAHFRAGYQSRLYSDERDTVAK